MSVVRRIKSCRVKFPRKYLKKVCKLKLDLNFSKKWASPQIRGKLFRINIKLATPASPSLFSFAAIHFNYFFREAFCEPKIICGYKWSQKFSLHELSSFVGSSKGKNQSTWSRKKWKLSTIFSYRDSKKFPIRKFICLFFSVYQR